MNKILLFVLVILSSLVQQSCSDCYDGSVPREEFDFAIVNQIKEDLVGPNARYDAKDIRFDVNGEDIIIGNYIKDEVHFFIVDYSKLSSSDEAAKVFISESGYLDATFSLRNVTDHCFPHMDMNDLKVEGNLYQLKEQLFIVL